MPAEGKTVLTDAGRRGVRLSGKAAVYEGPDCDCCDCPCECDCEYDVTVCGRTVRVSPSGIAGETWRGENVDGDKCWIEYVGGDCTNTLKAHFILGDAPIGYDLLIFDGTTRGAPACPGPAGWSFNDTESTAETCCPQDAGLWNWAPEPAYDCCVSIGDPVSGWHRVEWNKGGFDTCLEQGEAARCDHWDRFEVLERTFTGTVSLVLEDEIRIQASTTEYRRETQAVLGSGCTPILIDEEYSEDPSETIRVLAYDASPSSPHSNKIITTSLGPYGTACYLNHDFPDDGGTVYMHPCHYGEPEKRCKGATYRYVKTGERVASIPDRTCEDCQVQTTPFYDEFCFDCFDLPDVSNVYHSLYDVRTGELVFDFPVSNETPEITIVEVTA
jgi:hypothetical protein